MAVTRNTPPKLAAAQLPGLQFKAPRPPDWRWQLICKAVEDNREPDDSLLRRVCDVIRGRDDDCDVEEALYLASVPFERDTLFAFLMCGASFDQIHQALGVKESAARLFEKLYFDRNTFKNKMEWRMYVQYFIQNCNSAELARQIEAGLTYGPLVLVDQWSMGGDAPAQLPAQEMLSKWAMTSFSKAIVARKAPITSPAAKEAFKWGSMAVKSIAEWQAVATAGANDAPNALVAIEQRQSAYTPEEVCIDVDSIEH